MLQPYWMCWSVNWTERQPATSCWLSSQNCLLFVSLSFSNVCCSSTSHRTMEAGYLCLSVVMWNVIRTGCESGGGSLWLGVYELSQLLHISLGSKRHKFYTAVIVFFNVHADKHVSCLVLKRRFCWFKMLIPLQPFNATFQRLSQLLLLCALVWRNWELYAFPS